MGQKKIFTTADIGEPFFDYSEFTEYLFTCVNIKINSYIEDMKKRYAVGNGDFKNVLYPDLQIASTQCQKQISDFMYEETEETGEDSDMELPEGLEDLLMDFAESTSSMSEEDVEESDQGYCEEDVQISYIRKRAEKYCEEGGSLPLYELCHKLEFSDFSIFALACGILAATQTSYAGIFQVINQNGSQPVPTIESAAKIYYGRKFSVTTTFSEMSNCLEQLIPILDLTVNRNLPFSTLISLDKRMIDFLYGSHPEKLDENYDRFFSNLFHRKEHGELDPIMTNEGVLGELEIAYSEGSEIISLWGDEGAGRKFFIRQFCKNHNMEAVSVNCKKLFVYDYSFVEKALWAICRECILKNAVCCMDELVYRGDEEKSRFFGYLDLAFARLTAKKLLVFTISEEKIPLREATTMDYTQLELPIPTNAERVDIWTYYAKPYVLGEDIDMEEMAVKFLFTPGKIKKALAQGRSLSTMQKFEHIDRKCLFQGCYNQMKHELTQKATKVKATYTFDDIVMPPDQKETMMHVIEQMTFRKQVYEGWDYNRKYPYGRGLSVLLFGAPGTGKTMCAQVIANALNLELYRVDLSKVIDKYVGETEKSISMIFREAKKCNVVLFFDECDTLFGKRSDKGGSNEQSANNKTAHLLQEVEAYDGVTVLATNYKHNIDPAFFRRMKFIVEFQFPDPETRYRIWKATIPKNTPLDEDVDLRFLADKFEFVGGNIKNCILNAAFLAAADGDGKVVSMKHYLMAIRYEFVKTGKVFTRADFEPYATLVGL